MAHCNESSQPDAGGVASCPPDRAGLRRPARGVEPTAVFVVIEMAVLFCVSALAMVSIIVSIDDGAIGQRAPVARVDDRSPTVAVGHGALTSPGRYVAQDATRIKPTAQVAQ